MDVAPDRNIDMDSDSRMSNVNAIRDRISQAHYEVDPAAVAAAIVERLLAGMQLANELKR